MPSNDTYFKPGQSGNPGGKPKGSKNLMTKLRAQVVAAMEEAGGEGGAQAYLLQAAREDRKTFLGFVAKLLPSKIDVGAEDNDLGINIIVRKYYGEAPAGTSSGPMSPDPL